MDMSPEIITSRQNPYVLYVCRLSDKKWRDEEKKFRIDGIKLFEEAALSDVEIESVLVNESAKDRILPIVEKHGTHRNFSVKLLSDGVFEKISEEKSPEGIICVAKHIDKFHKIATINNKGEFSDDYFSPRDRIFAVESVRDPGNLGTIVRSAAALGVDCLIMSGDCADIYNPRTLRAAMGAIFRLNTLRVADFPGAVKAIGKLGRRTYAAALGKSAVLLGKTGISGSDCIVVGNEGHGLSDKTVAFCDERLLIPMTEGAESLNAAIAASICMWEQFGKTL